MSGVLADVSGEGNFGFLLSSMLSRLLADAVARERTCG